MANPSVVFADFDDQVVPLSGIPPDFKALALLRQAYIRVAAKAYISIFFFFFFFFFFLL